MEKAPQTAYAVEIDIASWLGTETIQSVAYSAVDEDGVDVTTTLLDSGKHAFSGSKIKPWVRAGTAGKSYLVFAVVTTTVASVDVWGIHVTVKAVA
jgi:hypothetical protein